MADGGLGQVERSGQVADAYLAALVRADQRHQPQPDRVTQGTPGPARRPHRCLSIRTAGGRRGGWRFQRRVACPPGRGNRRHRQVPGPGSAAPLREPGQRGRPGGRDRAGADRRHRRQLRAGRMLLGSGMKFLETPLRFLFFTGKGGVGKTSVGCAAALHLAGRARPVLLVSTDPASNVGQVLGVTIGNIFTPVDQVPGLSALEINPGQAAEAHRERIIAPVRGLLPDKGALPAATRRQRGRADRAGERPGRQDRPRAPPRHRTHRGGTPGRTGRSRPPARLSKCWILPPGLVRECWL